MKRYAAYERQLMHSYESSRGDAPYLETDDYEEAYWACYDIEGFGLASFVFDRLTGTVTDGGDLAKPEER